MGFDDREIRLVADPLDRHAVAIGIGDQPSHGEQFRHIGAGFHRQPARQAPEIDRFAGLAIAPDRAMHIALAGVISGDRQQPVAVELFGQRFQVIERAARGFDDVAATVVPPVLFQAITAAGARDELPETRGPPVRIRKRVIGAFDDRQQRNFQRHAARGKLAGDVMQITARTGKNAIEISLVLAIPVELQVDGPLLAVGQLVTGADDVERIGQRIDRPVGDHRLGHIDDMNRLYSGETDQVRGRLDRFERRRWQVLA